MTWRFVLIFLLGVLVGVAHPQDIRHPDGVHAYPGSLRVGKSLRIGSAGSVAAPFTVSPTDPTSVASGSGTTGGNASITAQAGGATTDTSSDYGGDGGSVIITAGAGGDAPSGSTNGTGGNINLYAGQPGGGAGTASTEGDILFDGRRLIFGGNIVINADSQNLTADDTTISMTYSVITLTSNNGTASNRTMVMPGTNLAGRVLTLVWNSLNAGELLDDSATSDASGNVRLVTDWTPARYDTITLLSVTNGANVDWLELTRTGAVPTTTTTSSTSTTTTSTSSTSTSSTSTSSTSSTTTTSTSSTTSTTGP